MRSENVSILCLLYGSQPNLGCNVLLEEP
eukprot:SAG31_NODE_10065_length_1188_cov_1.604224_1_plen_28_part_10